MNRNWSDSPSSEFAIWGNFWLKGFFSDRSCLRSHTLAGLTAFKAVSQHSSHLKESWHFTFTRYTLDSSSQADMHKTQQSFPPRKKKNRPQGSGHFYGHLKHKNDYTLYTKLKAEKVMSGGISNSCTEKKKSYFLEVFWVATGWAGCWVSCDCHKIFWVVVGEESSCSPIEIKCWEIKKKR